MTNFKVMMLAARFEQARQARDFDKLVALDKQLVAATNELEANGIFAGMVIVKGLNAYRKAHDLELLHV
jgi:hypothetical protein